MSEIIIFYFFLMKIYIVSFLIAVLSAVSVVSASTGWTNTGSTSTGSVSTGSISTPSVIGGGGIIRGFNYTTSQYKMVPQCFPWTWLDLFRVGNISAIYENQKVCREDRAIDFRM